MKSCTIRNHTVWGCRKRFQILAEKLAWFKRGKEEVIFSVCSLAYVRVYKLRELHIIFTFHFKSAKFINGSLNFTIMECCFCKKILVSEVIRAEIIVLTSWHWLTSMNISTGLKHRDMVVFRLQSSQTIYVFGTPPGREEGKRRSRGCERERDLPLQKKSLSVYL